MKCPESQSWLRVSVIIPFHSGLTVLLRTLASLSRQTYPVELTEVIVVTDCSKSVAIEKSVDGTRWPRIRVIRTPDIGFAPSTLRNKGIKEARGDVVVSLDFDMICPPDFLAAHLSWFHKLDHLATFGLRTFIQADGISVENVLEWSPKLRGLPSIRSISNTSGGFLDKRIPEISLFPHHPFPYNCFHGCNVAYWRSSAKDVGGWPEEYNGSFGYEDVAFGYCLHEHGDVIMYAPQTNLLHQENHVVSALSRASSWRNRRILYSNLPRLAVFRKKLASLRS